MLSTHEAGGVTERDIRLAEAMDGIAGPVPPAVACGRAPPAPCFAADGRRATTNDARFCYGEILGPEDEADDGDEAASERVRRKFWATFRKAASYIPFSDDLVAAYFCALDPATPHRVRAVLLAALAYFVLPLRRRPRHPGRRRLFG